MLTRLVARFGVPTLIAAFVLAAPVSSSAQSTYEPVAVVDDSGVQTTFTAPPRRIISLNPGHTGTVFTLGAGDRLVAVDTYIFADVPGDFAWVSAESVVARDPELIILADAYLPHRPQTTAMVATRPGWQQIAAVQNDNVYAVQEELFAWPSPRLADGLEALAYLVHPDRFADTGGPHLTPRAGVAPYCAPGQTPAFSFGFEALSEELGMQMGDPTECAHAELGTGDTYQQTTKGLAVYRRADNTPTFVSGSSRWSLTADGLVEQAARR